MKKIGLLGISLGLFLLMTPVLVRAEEPKVILETVKIVAFNLTKNNHVIEKSVASATLISKDGLILTNYHVVTDEKGDAYEAFAICPVVAESKQPECRFVAGLIARNKTMDVALLKLHSLDIEGNQLPVLPFLDFQGTKLPAVGEKISILGFPEIGGETITNTEGQISGYEKQEGITYLKTDATISAGNSGGTAKNMSGELIGIPSYLRSNISSISYVLPLAEIEEWIKESILFPVEIHEFANDLLISLLKQKYLLETKDIYISSIFPFLKVGVTDEWKKVFMNESNLVLSRTIKGNYVNLNFKTEVLPFKIEQTFLDNLIKKVEKYQRFYTNYKREAKKFKSQTGFLISYDMGSYRNVYFIMAIENVIFSYNYQLEINGMQASQAEIDKLLETVEFLDKENNTNVSSQFFQQKFPDITLKTYNGFFIAPVYDSQEEETILNIYNPQAYEQVFQVSEEDLTEDLWNLNTTELLDAEIKNMRFWKNGFKLINKYSDLVVDGLPAYAYTFLEQGEDFNQVRKETNIVILNNKKNIRFIYSDLVELYEKNISVMLKTLRSFVYSTDQNVNQKGVYKIPSFQQRYEDLLNYLYEKEINTFVEKNILEIEGRYFLPENEMDRMTALSAVIQSKIFVEKERGLRETEGALKKASLSDVFEDVKTPEHNQVLNYALGKKIITLKDRFEPQRTIVLAEALKLLCEVYQLPVWDPPYRERIRWYVPYMQKGQSLGVIPSGMNFETKLTRGEFTALLYNFIKVAGEREDF